MLLEQWMTVARSEGRSGRRAAQMRGQTTTEYVLVLSVLVIAVVGVTYTFVFGQEGQDSAVEQGLNDLLGQNPSGDSKTNVPTAVKNGYISANPQK